MGSLEDKVARLSPSQRIEAENFIDFILQKKTGGTTISGGAEILQDPKRNGPVHPVILAEERPVAGPVSPPDTIPGPLPILEDLRLKDEAGGKKDLQLHTGRSKGKDPGLLLDWID